MKSLYQGELVIAGKLGEVSINPFSAGTAFIIMQTGWIQASRRVTRRLA